MLLIVVLGVWGTIAYKIWAGLSNDDAEIVQQDINVSFNPSKNKSIDTFSVQTFSRDPFLGTLYKPKTTKNTSHSKKQQPLVWPAIQYNGSIQSQQTKQKLFVVTIDGVQQLAKRGQSIGELKILKGDSKKVIVRYRQEQKQFSIQ